MNAPFCSTKPQTNRQRVEAYRARRDAQPRERLAERLMLGQALQLRIIRSRVAKVSA